MPETKIKVERISPISGRKHFMMLPITLEQIVQWNRGEHIQKVFPKLSASEREFIKTGITSEEWDKTFKEVD